MPRRRGFSLKYRLLISLFVVSAIGIASAAYFAYREVYNTDEAIAERTMQGQANELLEAIVIDAASGKATFDLPPDWAEAYGRAYASFAYTIYEPDGIVMAKSSNLTQPLPASAIPTGSTYGPLEFRGPEAQMTMTAVAPGGRRLVVARSQVESEALAESMLEESIEPMLLLVPSGILALATIWLVGSWSLRPLERASREAADVGPGNPNARVSAEGLPAEVLPLVGAVNGALDRLSRAYEAERRLTADAAHELRTPLAVLDLRLQRAQLTGEVDWRLVRRDFQHLHRVVAQLLELARMESAARAQPRPASVNLARVVREATAMVLPLADEAGREIEVEVEQDASISIPGYAADLRNMVRNLLDNALHHGRGKITVTLGRANAEADPGAVVLQVRDEGSGVPDELRETVFDRFRKGKASSAGSGLGLAIVQHVAHTHGGFARVHPGLANCIEVILHGASSKQGKQANAAESATGQARGRGVARSCRGALEPCAGEAGCRTPGESGQRRVMKLRKKFRRAFDYWRWRLAHPSTPYEQYYVHRVLAKIKGGQGHPAIGPTARPLRSRAELLDFLHKFAIRPSDLVIDYGCGSLRLAPPLIEFLEPGKYWGMDLAQEFLDLGLSHLDPQLARDKRPRLDVIAPEVIERARTEKPRFIVSWHVCSKVPENRFDAYLGNIVRMMTPGAVALIHFPETEARRKLTGLAWAIPRSLFTETLPRLNPAITCEFGSVIEGVVDGIRHSYAILRHP